MPKIKVCYARHDVPDKSFVIMIEPTFTVGQFRDAVNKKNRSSYNYVWVDSSECDLDDNVADFIVDDKTLFVLTVESVPPSYDFVQTIMLTKTGGGSAGGAIKSPSPPPAAAAAAASAPVAAAPVAKPPGPVAKPPGPSSVAKPPGTGGAIRPPGPGGSLPKAPSPGPSGMTTPKTPTTGVGPSAHNFNNINPYQTVVNFNPNDIGIRTIESKNRPPTTPGKVRIFIAATPDLLLNGIEFDLNPGMTPNACSDHVLGLIKDKITCPRPQLLLYLPGGIPFTAGQLGDFFNSGVMKSQAVLYGVLTRSIKDAVLDAKYPELCNASNPDRVLLLSPICDSSEIGLADIACLLGYLNHDGVKGDLLMKSLAAVTHFPPLITAMNRIIERNDVIGRTVITVTGALFSYFQYMLPITVRPENVFEYGLRCCNFISHIKDVPEKLPILNIHLLATSTDPAMQMFYKLKQPQLIYFWNGDTGDEFCFQNLEKPEAIAIEQINNSVASFRPILPLSMRNATGASIVQGKNHNFLYLMQSSTKDAAHQNYVDIIDPLTGFTESKDVERFAVDQGITDKGNTANLIDPDRVKQLIMVCFDESGSMIGDIDGYTVRDCARNEKVQRVTIATQYLTTFANRTYGYRIPCIQGLISFNNEIRVRCPLSPLVPDFEDKGLKNIFPESTTHLWDAILKSCDDLIAFNNSADGKIFKNAASRILVISDGDDYTSTAKPEEVVRKLIENRITVDSVIVSSEEGCRMLCALSHITGGLAFRPKTVNEGLSLFEQSAFLNIEERKPPSKPIISGDRTTIASRLKPDKIDAEFMKNACEQAEFDTEVINKDLAAASTNTRLASPRHVIYKNRTVTIPQPRQRRILRELHAAAEVNDKTNLDKYDPDLQIYTFQSNLDRWRVYIKGSEGTPYANKWWYLFVTFPELYPIEPPIFRFVTIPYHLNVSSEGRICLNIIEKGYISAKHVVEIIQEIKELFLMPNEETPIQIETLDVYKHNRAEYDRLARQSAEKEAKNSVKDYLESAYILDESPDDFKIEFDTDNVPPYMRSQISGKALDPKNMVKASTGVYYDKDELKQIISSNRNPVCVITGKPLTETLDNIDAI